MKASDGEHMLRYGQSPRDRLRQMLVDAAFRVYVDRYGLPQTGADVPALAFIERAADAQVELFAEVDWTCDWLTGQAPDDTYKAGWLQARCAPEPVDEGEE